MRALYMRKIKKKIKKIPVFWKKCCYQHQISPIFLHFRKALGSPRRLIPPLSLRILTGEAPRAVKCRFLRFFAESDLTKSIFTPNKPPINGNVWHRWIGIWSPYKEIIEATISLCVKMFQKQKTAKKYIFGQFFRKNRFLPFLFGPTEFIFFIRWFFCEFTYQNYGSRCPGTSKWSFFGRFGVE